MNRLFKRIFCALVLGLFFSASTNAQVDLATIEALQAKAGTDMIHGVVADPILNAWQVGLVTRTLPNISGLFCGGALIRPDWVLTAAHCFFEEGTCNRIYKKIDFYVAYGSVNMGASVRTASAKEEVSFATGWNCETRANDIALIRLDREIPEPYVSVATESDSQKYLQPQSKVVASGWGITEEGVRSQVLLTGTLTVAEISQCKVAYKHEMPDHSICASGDGQDTCTGDSGGPLYFLPREALPIQLGVTSFSRGCLKRGFPGVYSKVSDHKDWIDRIAGPGRCSSLRVSMRMC